MRIRSSRIGSQTVKQTGAWFERGAGKLNCAYLDLDPIAASLEAEKEEKEKTERLALSWTK